MLSDNSFASSFMLTHTHIHSACRWSNNGGRKWRGNRPPTASINFVIAHDGFTLADLVSFNEKHNEVNGEENRDGEQHNNSWNCGAEGETGDWGVLVGVLPGLGVSRTDTRHRIKFGVILYSCHQSLIYSVFPFLYSQDNCFQTYEK
jgi:hypothetical protein